MDETSVSIDGGEAEPGTAPAPAENVGGIAAAQLRSVIERIERLEEDKAAVAADIKEVFAEAKANGLDTKILRQVIKIRKADPDERAEQEALLDVYLRAIGLRV